MSASLFPHESVGCGLMICAHTGSGKKDWGFLATPCPSSIPKSLLELPFHGYVVETGAVMKICPSYYQSWSQSPAIGTDWNKTITKDSSDLTLGFPVPWAALGHGSRAGRMLCGFQVGGLPVLLRVLSCAVFQILPCLLHC